MSTLMESARQGRQAQQEAERKKKHAEQRTERQAQLRSSLAQSGPPFRNKGHHKKETLKAALNAIRDNIVVNKGGLEDVYSTHSISLDISGKERRFIEVLLDPSPNLEEIGTDVYWSLIPSGLDPAAGDLKKARAVRKRLQLHSLVKKIVDVVAILKKTLGDETMRVVDVGAGSGHVGLLVCFVVNVLYGDRSIVVDLLDRKGFGCEQAEARIESTGLSPFVSVVEMDAIDYKTNFHLAVSLHSCGVLTDIAQQVSIACNAAYVLCPCCYGQLNDMKYRGSFARPRSKLWTEFAISMDTCLLIASSADFSPQPSKDGKRKAWDFALDENYLLAKQAMQALDHDRNSMAVEHGYVTNQTTLNPITCSPKNNLIIGIPSQFLAGLNEDS